MTTEGDDTWRQIQQNYSTYLQETKGSTGISIGEVDTGFPLRDAILEGMSISISRPGTGREYLISGNPELPAISELTPDTLARVSSELSIILQVAITQDHLDLWEWTHDALESLSGGDEPFMSSGIWHNLQTLFELALCDAGSPIGSREERVLFKTNFIAGYLAYPILEGFLKRLCADDLQADGTVKSSNTVYNLRNGDYYDSGDECNSLTDILYHFEHEVADDFLSSELEKNRRYIAKFGDDEVTAETAYGLIYDWRNSILHGQNQADVQYGITLNMICMIVWHHIDVDKQISGDWGA